MPSPHMSIIVEICFLLFILQSREFSKILQCNVVGIWDSNSITENSNLHLKSSCTCLWIQARNSKLRGERGSYKATAEKRGEKHSKNSLLKIRSTIQWKFCNADNSDLTVFIFIKRAHYWFNSRKDYKHTSIKVKPQVQSKLVNQ